MGSYTCGVDGDGNETWRQGAERKGWKMGSSADHLADDGALALELGLVLGKRSLTTGRHVEAGMVLGEAVTRAEGQGAVGAVADEAQGRLRALGLGERVLGVLAPLLRAAAAEPHGDLSDDERLEGEEVLREEGAVPGSAGPGEAQMGGEGEREPVVAADGLEDRLPAVGARTAAGRARGAERGVREDHGGRAGEGQAEEELGGHFGSWRTAVLGGRTEERGLSLSIADGWVDGWMGGWLAGWLGCG